MTAPETHTGVKLPVLEREPLVLNNRSYHWITDRICGDRGKPAAAPLVAAVHPVRAHRR